MVEQVRILFVDDEVSILKALKRLFMDSDFEIITASSGDEGIDLLTKISPSRWLSPITVCRA